MVWVAATIAYNDDHSTHHQFSALKLNIGEIIIAMVLYKTLLDVFLKGNLRVTKGLENYSYRLVMIGSVTIVLRPLFVTIIGYFDEVDRRFYSSLFVVGSLEFTILVLVNMIGSKKGLYHKALVQV